jgi:hypothetical protein
MISFVASVKGIKLYLMRRIGFSATTFKQTVLGLPQRLKLENSKNRRSRQVINKNSIFISNLWHFHLVELAVTFQKCHNLLEKHFLPRHHIWILLPFKVAHTTSSYSWRQTSIAYISATAYSITISHTLPWSAQQDLSFATTLDRFCGNFFSSQKISICFSEIFQSPLESWPSLVWRAGHLVS